MPSSKDGIEYNFWQKTAVSGLVTMGRLSEVLSGWSSKVRHMPVAPWKEENFPEHTCSPQWTILIGVDLTSSKLTQGENMK